MTRPRHAMRPHPLRSPGVLVGVPVAAAVAFGAHAVLGIVPVADQGTPAPSDTPSAAPAPAAPVQGYGLATAPPPTTLGLLSAPGTEHGTTTGNGASTVPIAGSTTAAHHAGAPARTVPITRAAGAPAPTMMTFSAAHGAPAPAAAPVVPIAAAPQAAAPQAAAPAPAPQTVQRAAAPGAAPAPDDGGSSDEGSSGGSLADVDLGVAKVSLLSFGS